MTLPLDATASAVLEVARDLDARHSTLLTEAALTALLGALAPVMPAVRISVALLEEPEHLRVYVAAGVDSRLAPVGARTPGGGVAWRAVVERGEAFMCDDTRLGGGHAFRQGLVRDIDHAGFTAFVGMGELGHKETEDWKTKDRRPDDEEVGLSCSKARFVVRFRA